LNGAIGVGLLKSLFTAKSGEVVRGLLWAYTPEADPIRISAAAPAMKYRAANILLEPNPNPRLDRVKPYIGAGSLNID
jgi:hypothetical protein